MKEKAWHYGCLFCRTGAEATIAGYINQTMTGIEAVAPMRTRRKTVAGKVIEDQAQLLPGYIFFRTEADEQPAQLTYITHILPQCPTANQKIVPFMAKDRSITQRCQRDSAQDIDRNGFLGLFGGAFQPIKERGHHNSRLLSSVFRPDWYSA